ncbi:SNF4b family protein [Salix suchowensis]|nr:SNF4b family protein [Salix suchowensis]
MAVSLLAREVSDLCLGKPALKSLSLTATVTEVVFALKNSDENFLSVWSCEHTGKTNKEHRGNCEEDGGDTGECKCVGKVSMVDVICYLCKDENLLSPSDALKAPVSALLPEIPGMVVHVEPTSSLTFFMGVPKLFIVCSKACLYFLNQDHFLISFFLNQDHFLIRQQFEHQ